MRDAEAYAAVRAAVLKRDPNSLLEALAMFDNERRAVEAAAEAVSLADRATRSWWSTADRKKVHA